MKKERQSSSPNGNDENDKQANDESKPRANTMSGSFLLAGATLCEPEVVDFVDV